jgi:hypothetical protein
LGLDLVKPDDQTLQLDFDSEEAYETFLNRGLPSLIGFIGIDRVLWTESMSGNKHVTIKLSESMPITERIAFQAALGSDPTRELLALIGDREGKRIPVCFFEKPDAVEVVIYATDGYIPQLTAGK